MSRIGNKPIEIPAGVTVDVAPGRVTVNGPKGELTQLISRDMDVKVDDGVLTVARPTDRGEHRALHGLTRSLVANMVVGVTEGYRKSLEISGTGYRVYAEPSAELVGATLVVDGVRKTLTGQETLVSSSSRAAIADRTVALEGAPQNGSLSLRIEAI